jgi:hypothetical protein
MVGMASPQSASLERRASSLGQAVRHLQSWPSLTLIPTAAGAVFTSNGHEIVRLTGRSTARLHLTGPVIERLENALNACTHLDPDSERGWVAISVETPLDLELLLALVSVAIKANDRQ